MITVKCENLVVFLDEGNYAEVEFNQDRKTVVATPRSSDSKLLPKKITGVSAVGYTNSVQPTSLLFESNQSAAEQYDRRMVDGVYIVYKNGTYLPFSKDLKRKGNMRVGISWHGHRWLIGTDYGDVKWSKTSVKKLEDNRYGIMKEWEAMFDWDYMKARDELIGLWKHIPFKEDETMPTAPMVFVQEYLAEHGCLNDALTFCGMPEYEVGIDRWIAERNSAYHARCFFGDYGGLSINGALSMYRVQAVALWR